MALTTSSCNDWLDVESSTEFDQKELFSNEAGYADAMAGIYSKIIDNNLYGKALTWQMLELMGGGAVAMQGDNSSIQQFMFQPNSSYYYEALRLNYCDPIWNKGYNVIANVNAMLKTIDGDRSAFEGTDYEVFKGEALGLRAFLHFDLLRLYGPAGTVSPDVKCIPYVNELSSDVHPLLSVKACADSIIADLKRAKELLKADPMYTGNDPSQYTASTVTGNATYRSRYGIKSWHNRRFHFNYYAAVATMARVYLWMGDKTNALACTKEVIDAQADRFPWVNPTLVANVASSSQYESRDRTFSTEQIFAMNITDMADRMDGYLLENTVSFSGSAGNVLGFDASVFDESNRASDPRWAYLHTTTNIYGTTYYITNKYYKDNDYENSYSPWSANRVPLIRLAEMYYIAAECEPDLTKATEYLEQVRQHRGLSAYPLSISSRDELQAAIENEYARETIGEGQMFYYHKRLNENIVNKSAWSSTAITPDMFTLPRPDDEDVYGGR